MMIPTMQKSLRVKNLSKKLVEESARQCSLIFCWYALLNDCGSYIFIKYRLLVSIILFVTHVIRGVREKSCSQTLIGINV